MSIKSKLGEKFLTPNSRTGRMINVTILIVTALGAFAALFLVKVIICSETSCTDTNLDKLIDSISPLFGFYGMGSLVIGNFISKNKNIPSLYADSITLITAFGFVMIGILVFTIK